MPPPTKLREWVKVRVQCERCGQQAPVDYCVAVPRNVPPRLRCAPSYGPGGGSGGGHRCMACGHPWPWEPDSLHKVVAALLDRGNWGPHLSAGAVVLIC